MPVIQSHLDTKSAEFQANQAHHRALAADLRARIEQAQAGGAAARAKHEARGKLFVRDRIARLIDPDTAFLELSPLAAHEVYDDAVPAAGVVTGIGRVMGQEVVIVANDATVKGGTYYPLTVKKHLRAQEIAQQNNLPCIYLVELGRRLSAAPGRGISRPRPFRPHFLQSGPDVGYRHPADRRGDGLVHGRRRVCAGDER